MPFHSIDEMRQAAERRVPKPVFDFVAGGAGHDTGVAENVAAFDRIRLIPRALVDITSIDLSRELFGRRWAMPFGFAPVGYANIIWPGADEALARAAKAANIPYSLSTAGSTSIERIGEVAPGNAWFQLYILKDDRLNDDLLARADASGFEVLLVTVDVPQNARRLRNMRNGFGLPLRYSAALALDLVRRPAWCLATAQAGIPSLGNMVKYAPPGSSAMQTVEFFPQNSCGRMDWSVLKRIRGLWKKKLVVKGLVSVDDALLAQDIGVDGVLISNHGGRELEGTIATFDALPAIRAAVGPEFPLLIDSGVRTGEHILKALAAGATFVLVGRCAMFGVGAMGAAGAQRVVEILRDEMRDVAAHLGVTAMSQLSPALLRYPPGSGYSGLGSRVYGMRSTFEEQMPGVST
jgi:isopentenyl diphosphate isomerase/L-lactate dehydrogenase-like FMN-dependent dehydrogenase